MPVKSDALPALLCMTHPCVHDSPLQRMPRLVLRLETGTAFLGKIALTRSHALSPSPPPPPRCLHACALGLLLLFFFCFGFLVPVILRFSLSNHYI